MINLFRNQSLEVLEDTTSLTPINNSQIANAGMYRGQAVTCRYAPQYHKILLKKLDICSILYSERTQEICSRGIKVGSRINSSKLQNIFINYPNQKLIPIIMSKTNRFVMRLNEGEKHWRITFDLEDMEEQVREIEHVIPLKKKVSILEDICLLGFVGGNGVRFICDLTQEQKELCVEQIKTQFPNLVETWIPKFTIGMELEYLFVDIVKKLVIRTDTLIQERLMRLFRMSPENNLIKHLQSPDFFRSCFGEKTEFGSDGRVILGECRTNVHTIDISSLTNIRNITKTMLEDVRTTIYKILDLVEHHPEIKVYGGGGQLNESIGTHVHFGLPYLPAVLPYLNIINTLVNRMTGADRPNSLNPSNVTNAGGGTSNKYKSSDNDIRTKPWGFEWRPLPSILLNFSFMQNLLVSLFAILNRDYMGTVATSEITEENLKAIFSEIPEFWFFFGMTKKLSFKYSFMDYLNPDLNTLDIPVSDHIKFEIKDYILPTGYTNKDIKLVSSSQNKLVVPSSKVYTEMLCRYFGYSLSMGAPEIQYTDEETLINMLKILVLN
jgi:hypothetical protein